MKDNGNSVNVRDQDVVTRANNAPEDYFLQCLAALARRRLLGQTYKSTDASH